MTNPAYANSVEIFVPMLTSLSGLLDKAAAHAAAKKIEPAVLVNARLAPDMFPLSSQVRIACYQAKESTVILLGGKPGEMGTDDTSFEEMKSRIAATIAYLNALPVSDFEGLDAREIVLPLPVDGNLELAASGSDFLRLWTLPHFYFHVVTAYDILRHNGVELGKRDYMTHVGRFIRPRK